MAADDHLNDNQFRTYYHGHGRDTRALTGDPDWDNAGLFVSHDKSVAKLYGSKVDRVEMAPDTNVQRFEGAGNWTGRMKQAREAGADVVEFHRPHDFVGHIILNQSKIASRQPEADD